MDKKSDKTKSGSASFEDAQDEDNFDDCDDNSLKGKHLNWLKIADSDSRWDRSQPEGGELHPRRH